MQLFAIIARPESNVEERRSVVGLFLKQQLNKELIEEYLKVFDHFYDIYQEKQSDTTLRKKRIAGSSVKVLKICTEINKELTQKQKVVVLVRLLEFIKSDSEVISEQELEFVETVADTFNIPSEEYIRIKAFVLYGFDRIPNSSRILVIDNNENFTHEKVKHLLRPGLQGQIRIFNLNFSNMFLFRYLGQKELYLNGQLIQLDKVYLLNPGSAVRSSRVQPIYYSDIVSIFQTDKIKSKILFDVREIEYRFKGGNIGLHKMSFAEESGKLVGIMGASGAGKSTLLNVLNGNYPPTSGEVLINNINIHTQPEEAEGLIGFVSQDDLLIEDLTVFQNLYYNAKLCFDNLNEFQIIRLVMKTLKNLGLYEIRDMKVGSPLNKKISGGQRKRLNISLELIREPAILFLDEPTSGLSSRDSENILDLLKDLSLKGKLVFVVIHQPSSDIFKMFDRLLILDTGGYLIYNGDPVDSIIYFKSQTQQANWSESECPTCGNVNPEQIFNIVEASVLDEFGTPTHTRRIAPTEWENHYKESDPAATETTRDVSKYSIPEIISKVPNKFRQFKVFTIRDVLSKLANTQYLVINMLEAPLLAFLMAFIIKFYNVDETTSDSGYVFMDNSNIPVYIFMAVIIAIFVGLTVSAEEIIRDRKILTREKFLNLSWGSYLCSKVGILLVISAYQALVFVLLGNTILEIKGMYWQYWLVLFSTWVFSNLLGLNISDAFKTPVTIYILIPFLVIPQIILSGIIVKFDKLNPDISSPKSIPFYGEVITARWAYEAIAVYQFKNNRYQKQFYNFDKELSIANYKKDYWLVHLKNEVTDIKRYLNNPEKETEIRNSLDMVKKEIKKEIRDNPKSKITFSGLDDITYENFSDKDIEKFRAYFEEVNKYYMKKYNKTSEKKDNLMSSLQNNEEKRKAFIELRKKYHNESLKEFVKNENDMIKIIEYDNELIQKTDPIFHDPAPGTFLKAHFYAPQKRIFGELYDTFWVNISVIWSMTITLFIALYFNLLKRLLEFSGHTGKLFKKKTHKHKK